MMQFMPQGIWKILRSGDQFPEVKCPRGHCFDGIVRKEVDEELTCELSDGSSYEQNIVEKEALKLLVVRRDICRQKSEAVLPSSKPNIREILWQSMQLRNVESRLVEGNIRLSGKYWFPYCIMMRRKGSICPGMKRQSRWMHRQSAVLWRMTVSGRCRWYL